jgi:predicted RNA binding protein YcfA (HicA-like mRNA interferase family)
MQPPSGKELVRILERLGWTLHHVSGSHHIMKHKDGRVTTVPVHGNRPLKQGTYSAIRKQAGIPAKVQ